MNSVYNLHDMATALAEKHRPLTLIDEGHPDLSTLLDVLNVARGWGAVVLHREMQPGHVDEYLRKVHAFLKQHSLQPENFSILYTDHDPDTSSIACLISTGIGVSALFKPGPRFKNTFKEK